MKVRTNASASIWKVGRSITAIEALHYFNCFRLSGRIHNLKGQGLRIKSEMIEVTSDGKQKRVAKYSLQKESK